MLFLTLRCCRVPLNRALLALLISLLFWPCPNLYAQPLLGLADAIDRTLAENPELAVFRLRDAALRGRVQTAAQRPPLELGGEFENLAGTGDAPEPELTIALSSVIELGGQRQARVAAAQAAGQLLIADEQVKALDLLGEVIRRYVEVLAVTERVALAGESLGIAQNALDAVRHRVNAAAAPRSEQSRAEATLAEAQLTLQAEQRWLEYHKSALAALWSKTETAFSVDSKALYRIEQSAGFAELYARAQQNPAIARFAAEERLRAMKLRMAETESNLDIGWAVGVRRFTTSEEMTLVAAAQAPLFAAQRNAGAVATASARLEQVAVEREAALLRMHNQLFRAYNGREQARIAVNTFQNTIIPALRDALAEAERGYRQGRYSYLELTAAHRELIQVRRALIESAAAGLRYGAEVEQLTAAPLGPSRWEGSK